MVYMEKVIEFLKERTDIKVGAIEKELGLPNATIKLSKGYIIPKHLDVIMGYLKEHYGYSEEYVIESRSEDNVDMPTQIIKKHNVGRCRTFTDGLYRFVDENGLWRRFDTYAYNKQGDGTMVLSDKWKPVNKGEVFEDELGGFYIANNGRKIYVTYKG